MTLSPPAVHGTPCSAQRASPVELRVEGRALLQIDREVVIATHRRPRLSWRIAAEAPDSGLEVSIRAAEGYRWDATFPGDVRDCVIGDPLPPHAEIDVVLTLRYSDHTSQVRARFETAAFDAEEWHARWQPVSAGSSLLIPVRTPPMLRRARLMVAARGLVRMSIDGTTVNPGRLDPSRTDPVRALYRVFDVTDLIHPDGSTLVVTAGYGAWGLSGHAPEVLVELVLHSESDRHFAVADDGDERIVSQVVADIPFYLEAHDAADRSPRMSGSEPSPALCRPGSVTADASPATRTVASLPCRLIDRLADGSRIYDVGTNVAGRSSITFDGEVEPGIVVEVAHGELLDADGAVDTTNISMPYDNGRPRQVLRWTVRSDQDVIEPWFAYYGFRYIQVQGLPDDADVNVAAHVLHTDLEPVGEVAADHPLVQELLTRGRRTLLNNVHSVPEDCPTREQAGWTADMASATEWMLSEFDMDAFLAKWLTDLATSQQADGSIPAVAPDVRTMRMPSDPVWGSALPRLLLGHWLHYGDRRFVVRMLPSLRRWAAFLLDCVDDQGLITGAPISYGHDWLALTQTPPPLLHTGAAIECFDVLSRLESECGRSKDAARWASHADELRTAARRAYWDKANAKFANGSQGALATAVTAGIVHGEEKRLLTAQLVDEIRRFENRPSGGFATTRSIVRVLQAADRSDVIWDMLQQDDQPGIGAMLRTGPGTFWESWSIDPDNSGTGSLNHVGLGAPFAAWVWTGLAGIEPTQAGYRRVRVAPALLTAVGRVVAARHTPRGILKTTIQPDGDSLEIRIEVPGNTLADLVLPGLPTETVGPGIHTRRAPASIPPAEPVRKAHRRSSGLLGASDVVIAAVPQPGRGAESVTPAGRVDCTPIPHEQPFDDVFLVTGEHDAPRAPVAILPFENGRDLSAAHYLSAFIDLCWLDSPHEHVLTMTVTATDGTSRRATSKPWPSGWNKVSVDIADWSGRNAVSRVEVGLARTGRPASNAITAGHADESARTSFRLGAVSYGRTPRTW